MTWQNLLDFVTQLINGEVLGDNDFNRLLLHAQRKYESKREWAMLKRQDSSQTISPADATTNGSAYKTAKSLPSDFSRHLVDKGVVLVDSTGNEFELLQIPFEARQAYYNMFGYYCVDFYSQSLFIMGNPTQTYTILQNYQANPKTIVKTVTTPTTQSTTWIFPAQFHSILAYDIAINYKLGIDYDTTNAVQVQGNERQLQDIWDDMVMWDAKLQVDSLKGMDRFVNGGRRFVSGQIDITRP